MTTPSSPSPTPPPGDDRNLVAAEATPGVTFEDRVRGFWTRNRNALTGLCAGVALAIVAKGGWEHFAAAQEADVGKAYASAGGAPEQLKTFAAAQAGHPLAGLAQLRLADEAYKAGKAAESIALYEQAAATLKDDPLAARARLGRAVAQLVSGKVADGTAGLKALADDPAQFKGVRGEAAFHLASRAVEARDAAEAQRLVDQLMLIDATSPWTQQAMMLRASLPAAPAPAPAPGAGGAAPAEAKPAAAVEVKLPGK